MAIDYTPLRGKAGLMFCKVNLLTGEEFLLGWDASPYAEVFVDVTSPGPWRYEIRLYMGDLSDAFTVSYDGIISISALGNKR